VTILPAQRRRLLPILLAVLLVTALAAPARAATSFTAAPITTSNQTDYTVEGTTNEPGPLQLVIGRHPDHGYFYDFGFTTVDAGGTFTFQDLDVGWLPDGQLEIEVWQDGVAVATGTVTKDTPSLVLDEPLAPVNLGNAETYTVTGTIEDLDAGAAETAAVRVLADGSAVGPVEVTAAADGTFRAILDLRGLPDGPVTVEVTTVQGGQPAVVTAGAVKDVVPPAFQIEQVLGGNRDRNLYIDGSGDGSAITVTARNGDGAQASTPAVYTAYDPSRWYAYVDDDGFADGPVDVTVEAVDKAGNRTSTTVTTAVDRQPVALTVDGAGQTIPVSDRLTLTGTIESGATGDVEIAIPQEGGGTTYRYARLDVAADGSWSSTSSVEFLSEGLYNATVRGFDAVYNETRVAFSLQVERTPPTLLVDPPEPVRDGSALAVTGSVSGAGSVRVALSDGQHDLAVTELQVVEGPYAASLDIGDLPDTLAEVDVTAVDEAGNETTVTVPVLIDRERPEVQVGAEGDGVEGGKGDRLVFSRVDTELSQPLVVRWSPGEGQPERTVTIGVGHTAATVEVERVDDDRYQPDDVLAATLLPDPGYVLAEGATSAVVVVVDDQPAPPVGITVAPAQLREDEGGEAVFTIARTTADAGPITVRYERDGGADDGDVRLEPALPEGDVSGAVLLAEGQLAATVAVLPVGDSAYEEVDDALTLRLLPGPGYTVAGDQAEATLTIVQDDPAPVVPEDPAPVVPEDPAPPQSRARQVVVDPDAAGTAVVAVEQPEGTITVAFTGVETRGTLTVEPADGAGAPPGVTPLGVAYELTASGGLTFDTARIELPYDESQLAAVDVEEDELVAVHLADDGSVEDATEVIEVGRDVVVAETRSFSTFLLGAYNIDRLAGADRYETAARVSAATFPADVEVAYVATGGVFADALTGGPAAGRLGAPILLVGDRVPAATATELIRLDPDRIVVLGGEQAVPAHVEAALAAYADRGVSRLAGTDRYATAAAVSAAGWPETATTVYVATGADYPDALAGAAAAGREDAPLLLVGETVPAVTAAELERLDPDRIVVLGGAVAVPAGVEQALRATGAVVERLAGEDRYGTAAAVAASAPPGGSVYLATGTDFPDALTAAPAAVQDGGEVLLVGAGGISAATSARLDAADPRRIVLLGGTAAVPADVEVGLRPSLLE